jgi:hypothetical protein
MSWNNNLGLDGGRNQNDRSRKLCVCGGHNASNVKRNLHHNSTKSKLNIRKNRYFKSKMKGKLK